MKSGIIARAVRLGTSSLMATEYKKPAEGDPSDKGVPDIKCERVY